MNVEFVDTNILIYAHDSDAGRRFLTSVELITRLALNGNGAISTQVLVEFVSAATRKLRMTSEEAEAVIEDLASWTVHRPSRQDVIGALQLLRRHQLSWWDALVIRSAIESGARTLWSEDFSDGQKFGDLTVRNPFRVQ